MTDNKQFHGSDLEKIEKIYGIPKNQIISFGANVNPLGASQKVHKALCSNMDSISRYPDRDYVELRKAIGNYTNAKPEYIMVGNGCTELISLFIKTLSPRNTLILGPSYSEYERDIELCKGSYKYFFLKEGRDFDLNVRTLFDKLAKHVNLLIFCNPNNPTSTALSVKTIQRILSYCQKRNIFVLIDETYAEFAPKELSISAIPLVDNYTNLMILRGTSKFFAAPGLRLGYGICSDNLLLLRMKKQQNPWSVNSMAEVAGRVMFTDRTYIQNTRRLIELERARLKLEFSSWKSIQVYDSACNFFFARILNSNLTSAQVFEHCIQKGLMIRDCASFPGLDERFFRFCIMLPAQNDLLLAALYELLEKPLAEDKEAAYLEDEE